MRKAGELVVQCSCGEVVLALQGAPMSCVVCYCDTCQEGSRTIEELPDAHSVCEPDGGTAYVLYRKDRVTCANGHKFLKDYRLEQNPTTNRVVASCCNSALMMRFDDARHWIPVYRASFTPNAPAIQLRICTGFMAGNTAIPNDVPAYKGYAPALIAKLLSSRIAMLFGL